MIVSCATALLDNSDMVAIGIWKQTMQDDERRRETMGDGRLVRRDHRVNVTDGKGRWQTMKGDDGRWETRTDDVVAALGITGDRDTG